MKKSGVLRKAIFLTSEMPFPSIGVDRTRDANLVQLLMEQLEVELLCFSPDQSPGTLAPHGLHVHTIQRRQTPIWKRTIGALLSTQLSPYSEDMVQALRERAGPGTLLWVSRPLMAPYVPIAKQLGYRVIFDEPALESTHSQRRHVMSVLNVVASDLMNYYESRFCLQSDALVATCDIDATRLHRLVPKTAVHVIPSSVDCRSYEILRQKSGETLLFYGQLNEPNNIAGMNWFIDEVLPRLRNALGKRLPRVVVAGIFASDSFLARLKKAGIEAQVNPSSVRQVLEEAAVVFFPVQKGRGARTKILESMAAGRPVVTTAHGTEGLILSPGYDIAIADDPDSFTSEILRLVDDPKLREEMGAHAAKTVETRYDWRCVRGMVENLIASISHE